MADARHATSLEDQLRRYGDALEARRRTTGAMTTDDPVSSGIGDRHPGRRRLVVLAAAAAVLLATATAGVVTIVRGDDPDRVVTDGRDPASDSPTPTSTPSDTIGPVPILLPSGSDWLVLSSDTSDAETAGQDLGVWAWSVGDAILILVDGPIGDGDEPARDEAEVTISPGRTMVAWAEGDRRISLQGIGLDAPTLRSADAALTRSGDDWVLAEDFDPFARVLTAEPSLPRPEGEVLQIDLGPADSPLALGGTVTTIVRPGSLGSLFAELHEASSIGPVSDIMVAGHPAHLVEGPDLGYALAAIDGWVVTWQTMDPSVDLGTYLATVSPAGPSELTEAAERGESARDAALAVAAAQAATSDERHVAEVPRFVPPDPWEPVWVTDMALWTSEQWAQREAMAAVNGPDARSRVAWSQGFRSPDDTSPVPTVDIFVTVYQFPDGRPDDATGMVEHFTDGEPVRIGDLDGTLTRQGLGGGPMLTLLDDHHLVEIWSFTLGGDAFADFAASLAVHPDGIDRGFTVGEGGSLAMLFDEPGPAGLGVEHVTGWSGAWSRPGTTDAELAIEVRETSVGRLALELSQANTGTTIRLLDGPPGAILFEREFDLEAMAEEGMFVVGPTSTVFRYEPTTGLMVSVSVMPGEDPVEMLGALTEVDLETWRAIVEPVNADPAHPR